MGERFRVLAFAEGPITVAYREEGNLWFCTALEFDLVGTGSTREAAFAELREVFNTYMEMILSTPGKIAIYNPSDREEWESPIKEHYEVTIILVRLEGEVDLPKRVGIQDLRDRYRDRIQSFDLTPLAA